MKRITFIFTFLFITFSSVNVSALTSEDRDCETIYDYFDTVSSVCVWDEVGLNDEIIQDIDDIMNKIETTFSRTDKYSELYEVNSKAGIEPVVVSEDLFNIIKQAISYAERTQGKFDPTVGALVDTWNIDTGNYDWSPPREDDIQAAGALLGYNKIILEENIGSEGNVIRTVYLPEEGMVLDLGGIAKGFAADKIKEYLVEAGYEHAIINLGGNVLTIGNRYTGDEDWRVGIQDPEAPRGSGEFARVYVTDQTVVTSGIYERYNMYDDKRYHHIIDTASYSPVDNDLYCVTIIASSSADADALSTGTFTLGVVDGLNLIESLDNVEAVFLTKDHKIILSSGLKDSDKFVVSEEYENLYKVVSLDEYLHPENYEDSLLDIILVPGLVVSGGIIAGIAIWYVYNKKK